MKSEKIIENNGDIRWYKPVTDILHREDGPAVEYTSGTKYWYKNGEPHREDGPAIEYSNGDKHWYINGELHREDGPAVEHSSGTKWWYQNGKLHRTDGPAVEYIYYNNEYWFNNQEITAKNDEEFKRILNLKGFM